LPPAAAMIDLQTGHSFPLGKASPCRGTAPRPAAAARLPVTWARVDAALAATFKP
jgi:hypothetical protein